LEIRLKRKGNRSTIRKQRLGSQKKMEKKPHREVGKPHKEVGKPHKAAG
jgi:hypothetical protein